MNLPDAACGAERAADVISVSQDRWRSRLTLSVRPGDRDMSGTGRAPGEPELLTLLTQEADRLEAAVSRFRGDSELSRLNQSAGQWVPVSGYLLTVLTAALTAAEETGGLVDPTVGHLVDRAGYRNWCEGESQIDPVPPVSWPDSQPAPQLPPHLRTGLSRGQRLSAGADWRHVAIRRSGAHAQARIPAGCQLDLGATSKAWLADRIAERVHRTWRIPVVANMGGDLRIISGSRPWVVGVDPEIPGFEPLSVLLSAGGLATSGQGRRRWATTSGTAHHIIDPSSGQPATSRWWTVSVLTSTALAANTASTAALILDGSAPTWLAGRDLDAVLIDWDPATGHQPVEIGVGRWPAPAEVAA